MGKYGNIKSLNITKVCIFTKNRLGHGHFPDDTKFTTFDFETKI